jgi:hypothetical protein
LANVAVLLASDSALANESFSVEELVRRQGKHTDAILLATPIETEDQCGRP